MQQVDISNFSEAQLESLGFKLHTRREQIKNELQSIAADLNVVNTQLNKLYSEKFQPLPDAQATTP